MAEIIRILQIGESDLSTKYTIPDGVAWYFTLPGNASACLEDAEGAFEAALLTATPKGDDIDILTYALMAHTVFHTEGISHPVLKQKCAAPLDAADIQDWISAIPLRFWQGQFGEKLYVRKASLSDTFNGEVRFIGNTTLTLSGSFGDDWTFLLTFRDNIPVEPARPLEIWSEYKVLSGNVKLGVNIKLYAAGYTDYLAGQIIEEADLKSPLVINAPMRCVMAVSYEAMGEGSLLIGPLHVRHSRMGAGTLLPGGQRFYDSGRHEFFTYFDPMDMKPPLNVYFSGYRASESFEGYRVMRSVGAPFLLISDPRVEGGSCYLGSDEYEKMILDEINKALDFLGFTPSQLVLGGVSMGSVGALLYGATLSPRAIIAGKPLVSLGQIAAAAMTGRPDEFGTALDILQSISGSCDRDAANELDKKIRERLQNGSFSDTTVAVAYMREDDYDASAYEELTSILGEQDARIYGKGITGRHNDDNNAVMSWFVSQYISILSEYFDRPAP